MEAKRSTGGCGVIFYHSTYGYFGVIYYSDADNYIIHYLRSWKGVVDPYDLHKQHS